MAERFENGLAYGLGIDRFRRIPACWTGLLQPDLTEDTNSGGGLGFRGQERFPLILRCEFLSRIGVFRYAGIGPRFCGQFSGAEYGHPTGQSPR